MAITLAIDCMGGDHGPTVTVPAAVDFLRRDGDCSVILVGRQELIHPLLGAALAEFGERLRVHHAGDVIGMDEPIATALRSKKDSSMRVAVDLVKGGAAQGALSAGNTGALMAISRFVLKTLPGIDRPAIATVLPTMKGRTYVLVLGAMLFAALEHTERPSVGLLNIGEEAIKGNEVVKRAGELLRDSDLNFFGNVEGDDIYKGTTDVVVCDGFVGNVALKTSEGLAQMIGTFLREAFARNALTMLAGLIAKPALSAFRTRLDHRRYNGASLLGLRGIVFKSHGSADAFAFRCAMERAAEAARNRLTERIAARLVVDPGA